MALPVVDKGRQSFEDDEEDADPLANVGAEDEDENADADDGAGAEPDVEVEVEAEVPMTKAQRKKDKKNKKKSEWSLPRLSCPFGIRSLSNFVFGEGLVWRCAHA